MCSLNGWHLVLDQFTYLCEDISSIKNSIHIGKA